MALTTPNMGLIAWDQASDPYDHTQLAANFNTIDAHDHTPGSGTRITTTAIQDSAISTNKLANLAVTTGKIANDAVTAPKLDRQYVHPIGSIMPWWRPNASTSVPDGWVIATGQTLAAADHDFPGGGAVTLPDLRNKFLLGADTANVGTLASETPAIGYSAGNNSLNISHSHTIASHTHTIDGHSHTVNSHSHTVQSHTHSLADHRHVHFFPIANQVPTTGSNNWEYRVMNGVDMDGFSAIHPINGGTRLGTWPDVYYSPVIDTYTRYAGSANRTVQDRYPMIALDRLDNEEEPLLDATTASRVYDRFLTYASPPVDGNGNRVTSTGASGTTTSSEAPGTNTVGQTTNANTSALSTNPAGGVYDIRPQFVGVLYLIKVKNTV